MASSSTQDMETLCDIVRQEIDVLQAIVDITQEMLVFMDEDAVDSASMCMTKREKALRQLQQWDERAREARSVTQDPLDAISLQQLYETRQQVYDQAVALDVQVRARAAEKLVEYQEVLQETSEGRRALEEYNGNVDDLDGQLFDEQK